MDRHTDVTAIQRYRRDRRELLNFLLSASILKRVVMPPGAVTLDDVDLEQVSVDYVIDCARKGGVLELAEAIKKFHDELNLPPVAGSTFGDVFYLATSPETSGPPPGRTPPLPIVPVSTPRTMSKSFSLHSTPSLQTSVDDEIDDFEDGQVESEFMGEVARRKLNDASDLVLSLPPFKTGLTDDDLRETSYEILLACAGAEGGLTLPSREKKEEKKSKLVRRFTRSKTDKYKPQPGRAQGLAGLLECMRAQMEVSEAADRRIREALLHACAGRVGKKMDTLLVPVELLCAVSKADFADKKLYSRWLKRQLNCLEEGLINHPSLGLETSDRVAVELRTLIAKCEEAETLPSPAGPAQHAESLKGMRIVALSLAERAARGDQTGEVCHWADGYWLNVRLYEKLLGSVFDVLDEGQLIEEAEEILELLKSTWRVLGITQTIHDTCYAWVLFRQFVLTGELGLLQHAGQQMKRIASDGQRSAQERTYLKSLHSTMDVNGVKEELSYVQSVVVPIKSWVDKRLSNYHLHFSSEETNRMEELVTVAMVAGRLIAEENDKTGVIRMTTTAEVSAVAKQAEDYIWSSIKYAYERVLEAVDKKSETERDHPLALLAEDVQALAKKDALTFAPVLSRWQPQSKAISASLLHTLYQKELRPFLDGVEHLTDDVASVLPAADSLEQYLFELVSYNGSKDDNIYRQQMVPYQVEVISSTLIMRWVNSQLSGLYEWVERTIQQEKWEPLSKQIRHSGSILEVFRIIEEKVDQFFKLKLPMRPSLLKGLTNGLDNALQLYANKVAAQLGNKSDLIPPPPTLTRFKKEASATARVFSRRRSADPWLPEQKRTNEISLLTTRTLCTRLNSLHYILTQLDVLEDNIKEQWLSGKLRVVENGPTQKSSNGDAKTKNLFTDELSSAFDMSRKTVNASIDKLCEFTGTKLVFWDMREIFIDGLYKGSVATARIEIVVHSLDPALGELCELIVGPLRDRVVLGLLQASLEGFSRVLLDGGPSRAFAPSDVSMLEEDLRVLKEFFIADGEGLPRGVVENAASSVHKILNLYKLEAHAIIENFRRASEQMATSVNMDKTISRNVSNADTLLRILCHTTHPDASQFLKKQYKLPKSVDVIM